MSATLADTPLRLPRVCRSLYDFNALCGTQGLLRAAGTLFDEDRSLVEIVDFASLVADSAKLKYLDTKLSSLKRNGHRVLIFCQMTKMLDILEDFMTKKKYVFFRLDGSCNIADRRDMVK
jgi:SNF2 family DNA or RNA helicase